MANPTDPLVPKPAQVRERLEANRKEAKMLRTLLRLAEQEHGDEATPACTDESLLEDEDDDTPPCQGRGVIDFRKIPMPDEKDLDRESLS